MNETRKAIIDLIEPYMDKTLSDGCYLLTNEGLFKKDDCSRIENNRIKFIELPFSTSRKQLCNDCVEIINENEKHNSEYILQIIGHYDITAVLKYIIDKNQYKTYFQDGDILTYENEYTDTLTKIGTIPNRPLHLYTIQEEKDLLELLLKLK